MYKRVRLLSTHMVYILRLSAVCALIVLCVDSEIAAADCSAEDTRGSRIRNTDMDALSYIISSV